MEKQLKELFLSYTSQNKSMKLNEFENLINYSKIYNQNEIKTIFDNYSINDKLSFDSFKFAIKEIAMMKQIDYDNIVQMLFKKGEEEDLKKIEEKKIEILNRQENLRKNKNIKNEEKVKLILEDMCVIGNIMKNEIINEKKKNPEKFISIEEATKDKNKDNGINFCLGVLAQNLENIGITTAIEKESNNSEESVKGSEMVLQFIMNGMIDKKKLDLHFELGQKRNNELLNNKSEQEKFHNKLIKALSKECNVPEKEIIITNPQKGSYKVNALFLSNDYNNIILDEKTLLQKLKKSKEMDELKYLNEIENKLIMEGCKLTKNMLDPAGDRSKNWPVGEKRGGLDYFSPKGWKGFGLKVLDKYDNGNNDWLACNGNKNEWAVAYHGVGTKIKPKLEDAVGSIAKGGFKVGPRQAYANSVNKNNPGDSIGIGIYCTPKPDILEKYASASSSETVINGKHFMMGFMMRVKPDKIRKPPEEPDYWILNGTDDEMRPYRILVKEK